MNDKLKKVLEKYFKEHLDDGGFKEIETIFEAAVSDAVAKKESDIKIAMKEENEKEIATFKEDLLKTLDTYCDEATKEYMKENTVAIESNTKVEMAETLIAGVTESFKAFNYPVDVETDDKIKTLESKIENLETEKSTLVNEKVEDQKQIFEYEKSIAFKDATEGMPMTEQEELLGLVAEIPCSTIDEFTEKLETVKSKFITVTEDKDHLDENLDSKNNNDEDINESKVDDYAPVIL